jgi:hypothetical protein
MSFKFSIPTVAIAAFLTLAHGTIATAEVYKTGTNQVIVTGLTAKQKYPVQIVNAKNKSKKLKDKAANTCGEVTIDNATTYKSLVVGTETIDPTTLTTKTHARCNAKKSTVAKGSKKKNAATATVTTPGMTTTSPILKTTTTPPSIIPAAMPITSPAVK